MKNWAYIFLIFLKNLCYFNNNNCENCLSNKDFEKFIIFL